MNGFEKWHQLEHPNIRRMHAMGFHSRDTLAMVFEGPQDANDRWFRNMGKLRVQDWTEFMDDVLDTMLGWCTRAFIHA